MSGLVRVCDGIVRQCVVFIFFFQAEDGIRDLVRSRGLGDVYKRQLSVSALPDRFMPRRAVGAHHTAVYLSVSALPDRFMPRRRARWTMSVSYTHLTLPTSDLV